MIKRKTFNHLSRLFIFGAVLCIQYQSSCLTYLFGLKVQSGISSVNRALSQDYTSLIINDNDFATGKASFINDNEINYCGQLYDFSTIIREGNVTILDASRDYREETLLSDFAETLKEWIGDMSKHLPGPIKYLSLDLQLPQNIRFLFLNISHSLEYTESFSSVNYYSGDVLQSPPEPLHC